MLKCSKSVMCCLPQCKWTLTALHSVMLSFLQNVEVQLQEDFSDCMTPAVRENSTFKEFVRDCCRLSWEMCVITPPLRVTTDNNERFDDRYHRTYLQDHVINARIDYFLWPALYSHRHGEMLCKGRVSLHVSTSPM